MKAAEKPVRRLTWCSSSVMRTGGSMASIAAAQRLGFGRGGRFDGSDVQAAVAQVNAFEFAVLQPAGKEFQPPVEFATALGQPFVCRWRQIQLGRDRRHRRRRQQVTVETPIVRRSLDPDIARAQLVAQCRKNGGFIEPPVWSILLGNQLFPVLPERHWRVGGDIALAGLVEVSQQADCCKRWIVSARRLEFQRLDKAGRKFAQRQVAVRSALQRIFAREIGQFFHLALHAQQSRPTDGFINDREGVALAVQGRVERFDRVMKQAHQAGDVFCPGDIPPFASFSGAGKQAADQLVRHIERRIGEPRFEIDDRGDEDCAPPLHGIAAHLMRIGDASLANELMKAVFMDSPGSLRQDTDLADAAKPIEQGSHMIGLWCGRGIPQPGEGCRLDRRIGDKKRVQLGKLRGGKVRQQGIGGSLACPRPALQWRCAR